LRTPLASIKAAASSLRAGDVAFSPTDRDELLATVEESADRLEDLVENLLAMSRLQAGVLSVQARPGALDAVGARARLDAPAAGAGGGPGGGGGRRRPAARVGRSGTAGAGGGQPGEQRGAGGGRRGGDTARERLTVHSGPRGGGPRSGGTGGRARTHLRAVPA